MRFLHDHSILLEFHAIRTLHFRLLAADIAPIGGQDGAVTLLEGLIHGTLGFLAGITVNLLEKFVEGSIAFEFFILFFLHDL